MEKVPEVRKGEVTSLTYSFYTHPKTWGGKEFARWY
jgi:hypothetical protein